MTPFNTADARYGTAPPHNVQNSTDPTLLTNTPTLGVTTHTPTAHRNLMRHNAHTTRTYKHKLKNRSATKITPTNITSQTTPNNNPRGGDQQPNSAATPPPPKPSQPHPSYTQLPYH